MSKQRLHLILAGDVIESAGTRSYLREMIRHLQAAGLEIRTHFFQFRLNGDVAAGFCRVDDFDVPLFIVSGAFIFKKLPRPLYRLFERIALLFFLRRTMREVGAGDVVIGSGCLGALCLSGSRLPANSWWLKLGLIEEEGVGTLRFRLRKQIEAMHARQFRHRIVVSEPMGAFIAGEYGAPSGEQLVLPCLVDLERFPRFTKRTSLRDELGLSDKFVVTYVGTAAPWQCAPETVAFFALLRARMPHAFFWVFTPDREKFQSLLEALPADSWKIEFRPHHELAGLLPAADVACLVRRRERVNHVASPLKFPEYLSCGLPVLIGPEVGHYSQLVRDERLGVVVDPDMPDSWPQVLDDMQAMFADITIRERCRMQAEMLSWQAFAPKLAQAFAAGTDCELADAQRGRVDE